MPFTNIRKLTQKMSRALLFVQIWSVRVAVCGCVWPVRVARDVTHLATIKLSVKTHLIYNNSHAFKLRKKPES
jgi:hypothetical protein